MLILGPHHYLEQGPVYPLCLPPTCICLLEAQEGQDQVLGGLGDQDHLGDLDDPDDPDDLDDLVDHWVQCDQESQEVPLDH